MDNRLRLTSSRGRTSWKLSGIKAIVVLTDMVKTVRGNREMEIVVDPTGEPASTEMLRGIPYHVHGDIWSKAEVRRKGTKETFVELGNVNGITSAPLGVENLQHEIRNVFHIHDRTLRRRVGGSRSGTGARSRGNWS